MKVTKAYSSYNTLIPICKVGFKLYHVFLENNIWKGMISICIRDRNHALYYLGAHKIMTTPTIQIAAPSQSYISGVFLSTNQPHKIAKMINTPP